MDKEFPTMPDPRPPLSQAELKKHRCVARDRARIDHASARIKLEMARKCIAKDSGKKKPIQQKASKGLKLARKVGVHAGVQTDYVKSTLFFALPHSKGL